jgi:hypothetical protein
VPIDCFQNSELESGGHYGGRLSHSQLEWKTMDKLICLCKSLKLTMTGLGEYFFRREPGKGFWLNGRRGLFCHLVCQGTGTAFLFDVE